MKEIVNYQRVEAAFIFVASVFMYGHLQFSFLWFIALLFAMDIFMLGYLFDNKIGARVYNLGHNFVVPSILITVGVVANMRLMLGLGIISLAHISMDRAFGYGLKYETSFHETHLGHLKRK